MEEQVDQAWVRVHCLIVTPRKHLSSPSGPHSNIPEEVLLMIQRNLIALHSFLEGNPHLFHSTTGDYSGARAAPASDQEAWKVATLFFLPSVPQLTRNCPTRRNKNRSRSCNRYLHEQLKGSHFSFCLLTTVLANSLPSGCIFCFQDPHR